MCQLTCHNNLNTSLFVNSIIHEKNEAHRGNVTPHGKQAVDNDVNQTIWYQSLHHTASSTIAIITLKLWTFPSSFKYKYKYSFFSISMTHIIYWLQPLFFFLKVRRGHWIPWKLSYRQLWATAWGLEPELGSSTRAVSTLNCLSLSPAP